MNVNTSAATGTSDVTQIQSTKTSSSSKKTSGKSFDEEIKSASKTEENTEAEKNEKTEAKSQDNKTSSKTDKKEENKVQKDSEQIVSQEIINGEINFTDFKYHNTSQSILSQNIQNLINTKDLINNINTADIFEYDSLNMSQSDADFFINLVQNNDSSIKNIINDFSNEMVENSQNIRQNIQVSSVLMDKLSESLKNNKPFRIDFDKNISVIIKVNKDGSLSANFIPGDKAVEEYLRNNISSLKQRFDEENLSYSQLSYSHSRGREQQKQKKENKNE